MQTIKNVMTTDVKVVEPGCTLKDCSKKMKDLNVGAMPICNNDRILGMVTDRDIVVRCLAEDKDPGSCKVDEIMSKPIAYCFDDEDVDEVSRKMHARKIRRLMVLNRNKRLVGIVSLGDLAVQAEHQATGKAA